MTLAFTRSPFETALSALGPRPDQRWPGRSLGHRTPACAALTKTGTAWPTIHPWRACARVITLVRLVIEQGHLGRLGKWQGEYYTVDFSDLNILRPPVRPSISDLPVGPVHRRGATGRRNWRRVGRPPDLVGGLDSRPGGGRILRPGWATANKNRRDFDLNIWAYVAIHPDRRQAIADARGTVAFYFVHRPV